VRTGYSCYSLLSSPPAVIDIPDNPALDFLLLPAQYTTSIISMDDMLMLLGLPREIQNSIWRQCFKDAVVFVYPSVFEDQIEAKKRRPRIGPHPALNVLNISKAVTAVTVPAFFENATFITRTERSARTSTSGTSSDQVFLRNDSTRFRVTLALRSCSIKIGQCWAFHMLGSSKS